MLVLQTHYLGHHGSKGCRIQIKSSSPSCLTHAGVTCYLTFINTWGNCLILPSGLQVQELLLYNHFGEEPRVGHSLAEARRRPDPTATLTSGTNFGKIKILLRTFLARQTEREEREGDGGWQDRGPNAKFSRGQPARVEDCITKQRKANIDYCDSFNRSYWWLTIIDVIAFLSSINRVFGEAPVDCILGIDW